MGYYPRVRELREDHDLTQEQLRLTQPQYCRYEQGYRDLPTDILLQLAQIYHTSTDYLLGYDKGEERAKKKSEARFDSSKGKQVF